MTTHNKRRTETITAQKISKVYHGVGGRDRYSNEAESALDNVTARVIALVGRLIVVDGDIKGKSDMPLVQQSGHADGISMYEDAFIAKELLAMTKALSLVVSDSFIRENREKRLQEAREGK